MLFLLSSLEFSNLLKVDTLENYLEDYLSDKEKNYKKNQQNNYQFDKENFLVNLMRIFNTKTKSAVKNLRELDIHSLLGLMKELVENIKEILIIDGHKTISANLQSEINSFQQKKNFAAKKKNSCRASKVSNLEKWELKHLKSEEEICNALEHNEKLLLYFYKNDLLGKCESIVKKINSEKADENIVKIIKEIIGECGELFQLANNFKRLVLELSQRKCLIESENTSDIQVYFLVKEGNKFENEPLQKFFEEDCQKKVPIFLRTVYEDYKSSNNFREGWGFGSGNEILSKTER